MELVENRYYNPLKLNNTAYLLMLAIEEYFGKEIFKGEGSRIFYGSDEFAFRQRLNKLNPTIAPPYTSVTASQLQFPFGNYFRSSGWKVDTRSAIQNATAALVGFPISEQIPVPIRFLQTEMGYSLSFYFDRDDDAQNCYDILMWIQNPTPKQFSYTGLMYKNYKIDIPVIMSVASITWTNQYKENDWLAKNRIIVIKAELNIKSVIVDQYAAGATSSIFEVMPESDIGKFYITEEAILDFLSFKNDPLLNKENIEIDLISTLTPDPILQFTFTVEDLIQEVGKETYKCTINWDYTVDAQPVSDETVLSLYSENVFISFNTGEKAYVPIINKTFSMTGLDSNTTYVIGGYFSALSGGVTKLVQTIETVSEEDTKELKGMIGLTW